MTTPRLPQGVDPEKLDAATEDFFNISTFFLALGFVFVFLVPALAGAAWVLGWVASRVAMRTEELRRNIK